MKGLGGLFGLFALSAGMTASDIDVIDGPRRAKGVRDKDDVAPRHLNWGNKKRQRYNDLVREGYTKKDAFDIVENHKGIAMHPPSNPPSKIGNHILYVREDFTQEEIDRKNKLAIHVVGNKLSICKICGKMESELEQECKQ
jgi:hypothetical protein